MLKIGLACSSGVDSQVLLHWACSQDAQFRILHFNHQLRVESDAEAQFMRSESTRFKIPISIATPSQSFQKGSLELWARKERYAFFAAMIEEFQLDEIWTAHHQDDQVETLWMRLERGTGLKGLKGIEESRPFGEVYRSQRDCQAHKTIIRRPFLSWKKQDVLDYAHRHLLQWCEDVSNQDLRFRRNYWRQEGRMRMARIMPSPPPDELLLEVQMKSKKIWEMIKRDALSFRDRWDELLTENEDFVHLAVDILYPQHEAFSCGWSLGRVREVQKWWKSGVKPFYPLSGDWGLERRGQELTLSLFRRSKMNQIVSNASDLREKSAITGRAQAVLGDKMYFLETQKVSSSQKKGLFESGFSTLLELEDIETPLELRIRQPGDLFSPMQSRFHKRTLKKFMNEVGIPISQRLELPLVAQGSRVLWIPGWGVSGLHTQSSPHTTQVELKLICQSKKNEEK